ncbi:hypothetical protein MLD38_000391 [Melastoma candidum]|uniref:Uncharacterized protein n=1 Tax=Melastoma candidum TaxID=119954 RepID=A0ACB9SAC6_9MYRT|nr:hypothetical protein MLD38_000391 [Melastoma candidum]
MAGEGKGVVLLGFWPSLFAIKVKIALSEKHVDYEDREEDLSNKSDLLLKMNPVHKLIPVLIHDGRPVCESHIIIEYVDEVWNHGPTLLPADPHERARSRFWADFADKKVISSIRSVWYGKAEAQETAKKELAEWVKLLESEIGEKAYFGGETFGLLDLSLVPYYWWFLALKKSLDLGPVCELELPKLEEWLKRCLLRDSVNTALPDLDKLCKYIVQKREKRLAAAAPAN